MWRAFFLAAGFCCFLLGAQCLFIDKVVLAASDKPNATYTQQPAKSHHIKPPEWSPWVLMAAGAVVVLYSYDIPNRVKK